MKKYCIIQGNILDRSLIEPLSIDLTITSPPYNLDINYNGVKDNESYDRYLHFTKQWIENVHYWTKDTGRFCLNIPLDKNKGGQRSVGADITTIAKKAGWKYHSTIVWNEGNISRRTAWGSWLSASAPYVISPVELIIVLYKNEWKRNRKGISDITKQEFMNWTNGLWAFNGESKKRIGHPAPFPKELPKRCIKLFTYLDDIILDPFLGSGTTIIEAIDNKRTSIGIEISPEYCSLAEKRIQKNCFNILRNN